MKKLIIILLLITSTAQAQWFPFDFFNKRTAVTYNVRASNFFTRVEALGQTLTTSQKAVYNIILQQLSDSGLIGTTRAGDSLQYIRIYGLKFSGSESISRMNILDTSNTATVVNAPIFTDSCISGGTVGTGYLNSEFNPRIDSTRFKKYSNMLGVYSLTPSTGGAPYIYAFGIHNSVPYVMHSLLIRTSGNSYFYPLASVDRAYATTNSGGSFSVIRRTGTVIDINIRGNDIGGYTSTSTPEMINKKFLVLVIDNDGTVAYGIQHCLAADWAGFGLSADKMRKLNNIINNALALHNIKTY